MGDTCHRGMKTTTQTPTAPVLAATDAVGILFRSLAATQK